MTPSDHSILTQVNEQLTEIQVEIGKCLAGTGKLPRNVAFHMIGIGAYLQAMGKQILENQDKERV